MAILPETEKLAKKAKPKRIDFKPDWPWSSLTAVLVVIILYLSQYLVAFALLIYPAIRHWDRAQSQNWLSNSIVAQFIFVLLAEGVTILLLWAFLKRRNVSFRSLGWNRWPKWSDLGLAVLAFIAYFTVLAIVLQVVTSLVPSLNVNQKQQLGFTTAAGAWQLALTYISLAVLPPIVEETVFRGFLYGSLRKSLPVIQAILATSVLFGIAHLELGSGAPPLWTAAIDVFILSIALITLRVRTGSLWASVFLHSLKNTVAFLALFVFIGTFG